MERHINPQLEIILSAGAGLDRLSCRQLLLVTASAGEASVRVYEKDGGGWLSAADFGVISCFIGRNGVTKDKREGDGKTPAGLFRLGHAFGVRPKPVTKLSYRAVTPKSFWVDDVRSPDYNTWVEAESAASLSGAEHLVDYPREYAYAAVIEYNTAERKPGAGSAVFLHCGDRPTSGCVAVPEPDMLHILAWLDPELSPAILIHRSKHDEAPA